METETREIQIAFPLTYMLIGFVLTDIKGKLLQEFFETSALGIRTLQILSHQRNHLQVFPKALIWLFQTISWPPFRSTDCLTNSLTCGLFIQTWKILLFEIYYLKSDTTTKSKENYEGSVVLIPLWLQFQEPDTTVTSKYNLKKASLNKKLKRRGVFPHRILLQWIHNPEY